MPIEVHRAVIQTALVLAVIAFVCMIAEAIVDHDLIKGAIIVVGMVVVAVALSPLKGAYKLLSELQHSKGTTIDDQQNG